MKILNLYFSSTGNTEKVARRITDTVKNLGHQIDTVKVTGDQDLDLLRYDVIFVGSGVYQGCPASPCRSLSPPGWPIMPPPAKSNTPPPAAPVKK
jgi:Flavodoxin domain